MKDKLTQQGIKSNLVICRECFSTMLTDGKVQCMDGKWRHKLTKGTGDVCRFVHAYISCGFANETMNSVLNAHAKSTRRVPAKKKKTKSKAKLSKADAARAIKQMKAMGWSAPNEPPIEEEVTFEDADADAAAYADQWNAQFANANLARDTSLLPDQITLPFGNPSVLYKTRNDPGPDKSSDEAGDGPSGFKTRNDPGPDKSSDEAGDGPIRKSLEGHERKDTPTPEPLCAVCPTSSPAPLDHSENDHGSTKVWNAPPEGEPCPCGGGMNCIVSRRTIGDWVHVDQVMIANVLPLGKNCDSLYSEEQQEAITVAMEDHPDNIVSSTDPITTVGEARPCANKVYGCNCDQRWPKPEGGFFRYCCKTCSRGNICHGKFHMRKTPVSATPTASTEPRRPQPQVPRVIGTDVTFGAQYAHQYSNTITDSDSEVSLRS